MGLLQPAVQCGADLVLYQFLHWPVLETAVWQVSAHNERHTVGFKFHHSYSDGISLILHIHQRGCIHAAQDGVSFAFRFR